MSQLPMPPPPPLPPPVVDIETQQKPYPSSPSLFHHHLNWSKLVIAFCFGSALEIAHHSQQYSQSQFPSASYLLLCFAICVSFSCIFVAISIGSKFARAAQMLQHAGLFSAVAAFFLAVTSPFPLHLKFITWAVYGISFLTIAVCNLL